MMFSEVIWIYYTIVMFTSIEWNEPAFFNATWFVIAGIMGYTLNVLLAKRSNHILLFLGNVLVVGLIMIQNWKSVVPEGFWIFGLVVSIGVSFIFIRSTRLVYRLPTRLEILRRFEGSVIYYIIFALIFTTNKWSNNIFHLFFTLAIIGSLMGMVLTLQNHEDVEGNQKTQIIKVGQSGWFAGVVSLLLISIPLLSLTLLLPSINRTLSTFGMGVLEGLKWIALKIGRFLGWLFSLLPDPQMEATPQMPLEPIAMPSDPVEDSLISIPYIWIIGIGAILSIVIAMWFFTKLNINRKLPKSIKPKDIIISKEPWWIKLKRTLKTYLQHLKLKWCMSFSCYYHHIIYWNYHQVLKWGKKKGLQKMKSETSQEYVKKIIAHIPEKEKNFSHKGQSYHLSQLLEGLNRDYQATYYGSKVEMSPKPEYKLLINHLQGICLKGKDL